MQVSDCSRRVFRLCLADAKTYQKIGHANTGFTVGVRVSVSIDERIVTLLGESKLLVLVGVWLQNLLQLEKVRKTTVGGLVTSSFIDSVRKHSPLGKAFAFRLL
jgi:hypothetical protein